MEYIKVGQIIGTFGIRGEVKLYPLTFDTDRFAQDIDYFIGEDKIKVHIKKFRLDKKILIILFKEFDDINSVEKFKSEYLYISSDDLLRLDEDSYYIHELTGLKVYQDEDYIGVLDEVLEYTCNDIYVVKKENGNNIMIPAVKDFINKVDIDSGRIYVNMIEGMDNEI
ncbi:MAG: ribosome maturation factor RimM [Tissierellia bacterium]|nr:ribosome maturation factor RimM [Tissierellia bacterium]